jgi:hypothetical protein
MMTPCWWRHPSPPSLSPDPFSYSPSISLSLSSSLSTTVLYCNAYSNDEKSVLVHNIQSLSNVFNSPNP